MSLIGEKLIPGKLYRWHSNFKKLKHLNFESPEEDETKRKDIWVEENEPMMFIKEEYGFHEFEDYQTHTDLHNHLIFLVKDKICLLCDSSHEVENGSFWFTEIERS